MASAPNWSGAVRLRPASQPVPGSAIAYVGSPLIRESKSLLSNCRKELSSELHWSDEQDRAFEWAEQVKFCLHSADNQPAQFPLLEQQITLSQEKASYISQSLRRESRRSKETAPISSSSLPRRGKFSWTPRTSMTLSKSSASSTTQPSKSRNYSAKRMRSMICLSLARRRREAKLEAV